MTSLKPCPFCGGEAKIIGSDDWLQPICRNHACPCDWTDWYTTKAEAIEAWNTRAELGSGTCKDVGPAAVFKCSECGWYSPVFTFGNGMPCFCPCCGSKVVDEC